MNWSRKNATPAPLSPLFRWAGGKQRIVSALHSYLPDPLPFGDYVEPFFGAGSLFFRVRPRRALLGDLNEHLVCAYRHIRDQPLLVKRYLYEHEWLDSSRHYYEVRDQYNRSRWSVAQAARFVYLNRTCFNGIFRVSKKGDFNVPYGRRPNPQFPSRRKLIDTSEVLKRARLKHQSFTETMATLSDSAFVYLDPPYPPLNGTAFFTHYTRDRFTEADQRLLAQQVREIDQVGITFMMSNADTPLIRGLYKRFRIDSLAVTRWVTCKTVRHRVNELVIRNY